MNQVPKYFILCVMLMGCSKDAFIDNGAFPHSDGAVIEDPGLQDNGLNHLEFNSLGMESNTNVSFKIASNWGSASIITTPSTTDTVMHWIGSNQVMDTTVTYSINPGESLNIYTWGCSCFIELDVLVNDEFLYTVYDDGQQGWIDYTFQN